MRGRGQALYSGLSSTGVPSTPVFGSVPFSVHGRLKPDAWVPAAGSTHGPSYGGQSGSFWVCSQPRRIRGGPWPGAPQGRREGLRFTHNHLNSVIAVTGVGARNLRELPALRRFRDPLPSDWTLQLPGLGPGPRVTCRGFGALGSPRVLSLTTLRSEPHRHLTVPQPPTPPVSPTPRATAILPLGGPALAHP